MAKTYRAGKLYSLKSIPEKKERVGVQKTKWTGGVPKEAEKARKRMETGGYHWGKYEEEESQMRSPESEKSVRRDYYQVRYNKIPRVDDLETQGGKRHEITEDFGDDIRLSNGQRAVRVYHRRISEKPAGRK